MAVGVTRKSLGDRCMDEEFFFDEILDELPGGIPLLPGMKTRDALLLKEKLIPRPTDIFVTSFVRSGTNWVSYIIQLIVKGGVPPDRDLDIISPCIDTVPSVDEVEVCLCSAPLLFIV